MRIDLITVFPEMVEAALDYSIVKRARERGLVTIRVVNLRDFTHDRHKTTDDVPYGGGGGMVMKIEPLAAALEALGGLGPETFPLQIAVQEDEPANVPEQETVVPGVPYSKRDAVRMPAAPSPRTILTDPRGQRFTQDLARQWAQEPHLILICGHYEGVDERVRQHLITDEVSIGDYVLTGGELPALVIIDALTRLQPGALGEPNAPEEDSFAENLLEYPHYTRPRVFHGWAVPDMLLSGHHAEIERWRRWHRLHTTQTRRPDLFARVLLSPQDQQLLASAEPTAPPSGKREVAEPERMAIRERWSDQPAERLEPSTQQLRLEAERPLEQEETDGTGTTDSTGY